MQTLKEEEEEAEKFIYSHYVIAGFFSHVTEDTFLHKFTAYILLLFDVIYVMVRTKNQNCYQNSKWRPPEEKVFGLKTFFFDVL